LRWLVAVMLLLACCTSPEERLASHMERGEEFLEQGQTKEALLEFQNALKIKPEDAALHERIGDVLQSRGQYAEALEYFRQAYRLDDSRISAAIQEARLIAFKNPTRAHELLQRGLREAPELVVVQRARAYLAVVDGDTRTALAAAEKAIAIDPEDVASWAELASVHLARILERQKKRLPPRNEIFEDALAALDRVDQLKGGSVRARLEKARVFKLWPRHRAEARATYEDALALAKSQKSPGEIRIAAKAMDQFGNEIGDYQLRRTALRELVAAVDDDYTAWDDLGRLVGGSSDEEVYLELLERRPDDPRSHLLYVNYLTRRHRSDDAEAHLRRTLDDGLEAPLLWERLIRTMIQDNRLPDARALYVRMSDEFPDDLHTRVARARLAIAEGRSAEGIRQLHLLIAEHESAELQRLMALAQYRLGNLKEAKRAIDTAMDLATQPHYPIIRLKARINYAAGDWSAALGGYRLLLGRGQELSAEEKVLLARSLHRTGRRRAALEVFEELLAEPLPPAGAVVAYAELEGEHDPERARTLLLATHERAPTDHEVLKALTNLDLRGGRPREALARLNLVVSSRLATPATLLMRARIATQLEAYDRAEADVLRAFEADPTLPDAIDLLYTIYRLQGKLDEARRSFEQAEEAGVLHSGARLLLGRLYLGDGDTERAQAMLERVVADHPELWTARNDLAYVLVERGEDLDRALQLAREAHAASGQNPTTADTVGYVHLKAGRPEAGLQQFRRAIRLAQARSETPNPSFEYHRGLALRALGREGEAVQSFERALNQGDFPEADDARRQLEAARHSEAESGSPS
jgi:tetratricopeptide (TPR) repeat protein